MQLSPSAARVTERAEQLRTENSTLDSHSWRVTNSRPAVVLSRSEVNSAAHPVVLAYPQFRLLWFPLPAVNGGLKILTGTIPEVSNSYFLNCHSE